MLNRAFILSVFFLPAVLGDGRDIYVSLAGTNNFPYTNWPDAATNIQWAVNVGANSDTVWISNGAYVLTNQITVNSNLLIIGTGGVVVVDGNNANRCFNFTNAANRGVALANLTITRGYAATNGGGVFMNYGVVRDCVFSNNVSANDGGGIYINTSGTVQRCAFIGNVASNGGGLAERGGATNLIDDCLFYTNIAAQSGGGIYNLSAATTITGCDFICNVATNLNGGGVNLYGKMTDCALASNVANNYGGGVYCIGGLVANCWMSNNFSGAGGGVVINGGTISDCVISRNWTLSSGNKYGGGVSFYSIVAGTIRNCLIQNNSSQYGGGVNVAAGTIQNCLIRDNVAQSGGGLRRAGVVSFRNCTIVSNYASSQGGGIYDNVLTATGNFDNCVIYLNGCGTAAYSNYYFLAGVMTAFTNCLLAPALSGSITNYSTNNITADPQFVDWAAGNYRLSVGSPAVNAGINREWMMDTVDLDGRRRIDRLSGLVDIGCYEHLPSGTMFKFR